MKVSYVCAVCNSKLITLDAWAEWDEDDQEWVLGATYDYTYCHACDSETHLKKIALEDADENINRTNSFPM